MKTVRQVTILDIIEKNEIETQEELADALRQRGIQVTQATVSPPWAPINTPLLTRRKMV